MTTINDAALPQEEYSKVNRDPLRALFQYITCDVQVLWFTQLHRLRCRQLNPTECLLFQMKSLLQRMKRVYSTAKICRPAPANGTCFELEPDLVKLFASSRDSAELEWAWREWRLATGEKYKDLFVERVELANKAARLEGQTTRHQFQGYFYIPDIRIRGTYMCLCMFCVQVTLTRVTGGDSSTEVTSTSRRKWRKFGKPFVPSTNSCTPS